MERLHGYFERMKKTQICMLNEKNEFVPSRVFLSAVNSFTKAGLSKDINDQVPELTETLTLACCLIPFDLSISKIDLFHTVNILANVLSYPQIEARYFDNFIGWFEYFFPAELMKNKKNF